MTEDDIVEAVSIMDTALDRALKIVDGAPYWKSVSEPDWAKVYIAEGGDAVLQWFRTTLEWDSPTLDEDECAFPSSLLLMSDEELATWKVEQKAIYEKKQREDGERNRQIAAQNKEAEERWLLAALTAKYTTA